MPISVLQQRATVGARLLFLRERVPSRWDDSPLFVSTVLFDCHETFEARNLKPGRNLNAADGVVECFHGRIP